MATILTVREVSAESPGWTVEGWYFNALDQVCLEVREGEMVVLVGGPGSGKTMLIRVILNLLEPRFGDVRLFGLPPHDWMWKPEVGYMPQWFAPRTASTARGFLHYIAQVREIVWGNEIEECVDSLLDELGLSDAKDVPLREFSRDMIARLGFAQALLHHPRLLILDEPAEGIGSRTRATLRRALLRFRSRGGGILVTAKSLSALELSADRIIVMREGRIAAALETKDLTAHEVGALVPLSRGRPKTAPPPSIAVERSVLETPS